MYWEKPIYSALKSLGDLNGRVILAVACGDGRLPAYLASLGGRVIAFDICHASLIGAAHNSRGARYLQADAARIPVRDGAFDVTISVSSLQYMSIHRTVENCRKALRVGGTAIFVENLAGNPAAYIDRTQRRLRQTPESPNMRVSRYLSLNDMQLFLDLFRHVSIRVWYDWSPALIPFIDRFPKLRPLFTRIVDRTARPVTTSSWRSSLGWIVEVTAIA